MLILINWKVAMCFFQYTVWSSRSLMSFVQKIGRRIIFCLSFTLICNIFKNTAYIVWLVDPYDFILVCFLRTIHLINIMFLSVSTTMVIGFASLVRENRKNNKIKEMFIRIVEPNWSLGPTFDIFGGQIKLHDICLLN